MHALPRPIDPARVAFVRDVLSAANAGPLDWIDVNRLAALRLHPTAGDSSRYGHTLVLELAASGVLEADVTHTADGALMASRVRIPAGVHDRGPAVQPHGGQDSRPAAFRAMAA